MPPAIPIQLQGRRKFFFNSLTSKSTSKNKINSHMKFPLVVKIVPDEIIKQKSPESINRLNYS